MPKYFMLFMCLLSLHSCLESNPNLTTEGKDVLEVNSFYLDHVDLTYRDTVYIPIYSDIYSKSKDDKFLLTATLSIRNTSLSDTMYIEDIDYYDTHGKLVRKYLEKILFLKPMASIEYVIEEEDNVGGTGANYIVNWGAKDDRLNPVFQGVMISTFGQQGISFLTNGVSISRREKVAKDSTNVSNVELNK